MSAMIRVATPQDAEGLLAIYAPIVRDTVISFELVPPTVAEMQQRVASTLEALPWLVCEREGEILGYVYASRYRPRAAYQWAVEVSVYIQAACRRTGMGRALYTSLFAALELQGIRRFFAGITLPNDASVGLHESLGFEPLGVYRSVGYKFGDWHDVGWWQWPVQRDSTPPQPPIPLPEIRREGQAWERAIAAGQGLLRLE